MRARLAFALVLAACDATEDIAADEVIVGLTPTPASLVADGTATARLDLETAADAKVGLRGRLTVIGASWAESSAPTLDVLIGDDGHAIAIARASRFPGTAVIRAEVEGYERTFELPLTAAAVTDVAPVTSGRITPGTAAFVQLAATPIVGGGGLASVGTRIDFEIAPVPAGSAYLTAPFTVLDAATTAGTTMVVTGASTTSVMVTVRITPPGASAPTVTRPVAIAAVP